MKRWFEKGWFAFLVVGLVLVVYGAYFLFLSRGIISGGGGELTGVRTGTFGDAFGALNALFSALACGGVIATLLLQRGDLRETKKQALDQQFEANFYTRLTLQQNVVEKLDIVNVTTGVVRATGRDCLKSYYREIVKRYNLVRIPKPHEQRMQRAYERVWMFRHSDLSIYFRSLYSLFKFLDESGYDHKDKLGVVVRSLLSDYELALILYNCLNRRGENFRKYAESFRLFDNLDVDLLLDPVDVISIPKAAFGKNAAALEIFRKAGL